MGPFFDVDSEFYRRQFKAINQQIDYYLYHTHTRCGALFCYFVVIAVTTFRIYWWLGRCSKSHFHPYEGCSLPLKIPNRVLVVLGRIELPSNDYQSFALPLSYRTMLVNGVGIEPTMCFRSRIKSPDPSPLGSPVHIFGGRCVNRTRYFTVLQICNLPPYHPGHRPILFSTALR